MKKMSSSCSHPYNKQVMVVEGIVCDICAKLLTQDELVESEKKWRKAIGLPCDDVDLESNA
jgi:hypothetical protein